MTTIMSPRTLTSLTSTPPGAYILIHYLFEVGLPLLSLRNAIRGNDHATIDFMWLYMLNKFRDTFAVEKKEDLKKRPSDKNFQIRLYTKVNRDYWDYEDLREWYNKTGQKPGHATAAADSKPQLDAASAAFCVDR